jgi:hypothetical protein
MSNGSEKMEIALRKSYNPVTGMYRTLHNDWSPSYPVPEAPGSPPFTPWQIHPGRMTHGPCEAERKVFNLCKCFTHGMRIHWENMGGGTEGNWLGRCARYAPHGACTAVWARQLRGESAVYWGDHTIELGQCGPPRGPRWKRHRPLDPSTKPPYFSPLWPPYKEEEEEEEVDEKSVQVVKERK